MLGEDWVETPLRRLTGICLKGWHDIEIGEPFRYDNENIRLSPTQETSWEQWEKWKAYNRRRPGWAKTVILYCRVCEGPRRIAPKGRTRGI